MFVIIFILLLFHFQSNLFISHYLNKFDSLFKTIYVLDIDNVNSDDMVGLNEGLNIN